MLLYVKRFQNKDCKWEKILKGKRPREGYFSKNKQLFSCSLLQQLLNKEMFDLGATHNPR